MVKSLFLINISLCDGQTFSLPIPRKFVTRYVNPDGSITSEGLAFLTDQFYFSSYIQSGMICCNDLPLLFKLFAHKNAIRESISIRASTLHELREVKLSDCSRIFNSNHIDMNIYLTREGISLVFGSDQYKIAWLYINNYTIVFNEINEIYEYQGKSVEPSTPEKKHKSDEELVCPDAPKKTRK